MRFSVFSVFSVFWREKRPNKVRPPFTPEKKKNKKNRKTYGFAQLVRPQVLALSSCGRKGWQHQKIASKG
jgi:hypothetical protein